MSTNWVRGFNAPARRFRLNRIPYHFSQFAWPGIDSKNAALTPIFLLPRQIVCTNITTHIFYYTSTCIAMLVILSYPAASASLLRYSICKQNSNYVIYHLSLCAVLSVTANSPRPPGHARCFLLAQRQANRKCFLMTFSAPMHRMMCNSCPCSCFDNASLHQFLDVLFGCQSPPAISNGKQHL